MLIALAIVNIFSLAFLLFVFQTLQTRFRWIFVACSALPMIAAITLSLTVEHVLLPTDNLNEVIAFFFRGWFAGCIACGALGCYIASHLKK